MNHLHVLLRVVANFSRYFQANAEPFQMEQENKARSAAGFWSNGIKLSYSTLKHGISQLDKNLAMAAIHTPQAVLGKVSGKLETWNESNIDNLKRGLANGYRY